MKNKNKKIFQTKIQGAYKQLKRAYKDLKDSHIEMIFHLALMAEMRDPATGAHLVRIADYSAAIAEKLGLSEDEIEILRYASPMHDIGKIILPDSVLKKNGKLTEKEREIVYGHPEVGADIFRNAKTPMLKACREIALTHHERFDGTGYPKGLKGKEIPLYGRIVALADCFDAFTSRRAYKEPFSFEKSVSMIVERAGTHFDPAVVMAFVRNKKKIKKIWEANKDLEVFLEDMGVELE